MQKITFHTPVKNRLDTSVRPQDDFFGYVNNKWLHDNPIPASEGRWGVFSVLRDEAWQHMRDLYKELEGQEFAPGSIEQQARDLYFTGMHFDQFEELHLSLVMDYFAKIDAIDNVVGLVGFVGELHKKGVSALWRVIIDADDKDSSRHLLRLAQPRLTLPDRDYYLKDDATMQDVRVKFQAHVKKLWAAFPGLAPTAEVAWQRLWDLELAIAKVNRSREACRDVQKNYNKTTFADLAKTYAAIDWHQYAQSLGWQNPGDLSVDQPEVLTFLQQQLAQRPLDDWKTYLKWQFLQQFASKISSRFAQLQFEFFGKVLSGTKEILPLWKRVVLTIDSAMGEGVGRLYTQRHFPESSKQQVLDIVEEIRGAYKLRIEKLDWMSEPTRQVALQKLANIKVLIGYPDQWRDFSTLIITREGYIPNLIAAEEFDTAYYLAKLHKSTSREDWFMDPQTVNAYHDPNRLVICFPAAILQPPFFDPTAHAAVNSGAIGAVIGHEFTHGFDDQGCQFDPAGNVKVWQTAAERAAFTARAQVIIDQANAFKVLPDLTVKGKLVIGESIADLGGIEIAYESLRQKFADINQPTDSGLSIAELFFVSFATTEAAATREEIIRQVTLSDPHPEEHFRVNAMLMHVEGFYNTYGVKEGDTLYRAPENRAKIW